MKQFLRVYGKSGYIHICAMTAYNVVLSRFFKAAVCISLYECLCHLYIESVSTLWLPSCHTWSLMWCPRNNGLGYIMHSWLPSHSFQLCFWVIARFTGLLQWTLILVLMIYSTSQKKCTVITSVFTERIVGSNVKTVQYQITVKPY